MWRLSLLKSQQITYKFWDIRLQILVSIPSTSLIPYLRSLNCLSVQFNSLTPYSLVCNARKVMKPFDWANMINLDESRNLSISCGIIILFGGSEIWNFSNTGFYLSPFWNTKMDSYVSKYVLKSLSTSGNILNVYFIIR